jgi:neutral ceramidase
MQAAVAKAVITPPVGCWIVGPIAKSTGVHDELEARALVLADGPVRAAIVCLDLMQIDHATGDDIRAKVEAATGIPADNVMLSCSHTHSAPLNPSWLDGAYVKNAPLLADWNEELAGTIVQLVTDAQAALTDVTFCAGRAPAQVGFNRRVLQPEGVDMDANPYAPVVPWVDVLAIDEAATGTPIAIWYNHAAHPVIVHGASTLMSRDYAGPANDRIDEATGAMALFSEGCCGDINGYPLRGGFDAAQAAGEKLAAAVLAALDSAAPIDEPTLTVKRLSETFTCAPLPPLEDCEKALAGAEAELAQAEDDTETYQWRFGTVHALRDMREMILQDRQPRIRMDFMLVAVGSVWGSVFINHDVFSEYGRWADTASPFAFTPVSCHTNGSAGYIPTDEALALKECAGYEPGCFPAKCCPLIVPTRMPLEVGQERAIKATMARLWQR